MRPPACPRSVPPAGPRLAPSAGPRSAPHLLRLLAPSQLNLLAPGQLHLDQSRIPHWVVFKILLHVKNKPGMFLTPITGGLVVVFTSSTSCVSVRLSVAVSLSVFVSYVCVSVFLQVSVKPIISLFNFSFLELTLTCQVVLILDCDVCPSYSKENG